jgi:SprT protein
MQRHSSTPAFTSKVGIIYGWQQLVLSHQPFLQKGGVTNLDFGFIPLNDDELLKALGEVPEHTKNRVEQIITNCLLTLQARFPNTPLNRPVVAYDLKGHHAGWALPDGTIRLNTDLLLSETEDMLATTLPHEIAHVVQRQIYPRSKSHGLEWRRLMGYLGVPADRCHQYETIAARKKSTPYTYYCDCQEHKVTVTLHRRMLQGRTYRCRRCGTNLRKET